MAKWFPSVLALAVGALAALAAALRAAAARSPSPPALLVRRWPALAPRCRAGAGRAVPEPPPAPRRGRRTPMPSGFGRALIEKLPTPLLVVSRTGRVSYANPAAHDGAAAAASPARTSPT